MEESYSSTTISQELTQTNLSGKKLDILVDKQLNSSFAEMVYGKTTKSEVHRLLYFSKPLSKTI